MLETPAATIGLDIAQIPAGMKAALPPQDETRSAVLIAAELSGAAGSAP